MPGAPISKDEIVNAYVANDGDILKIANALGISYRYTSALLKKHNCKSKRRNGIRQKPVVRPPDYVEVEEKKCKRKHFNPNLVPDENDLQLVRNIAINSCTRFKNIFTLDELYVAGLEGLLLAKDSFNGEGDYKKYCNHKIRFAILDWVRTQSKFKWFTERRIRLRTEKQLGTTDRETICRALNWPRETYAFSLLNDNSIVKLKGDLQTDKRKYDKDFLKEVCRGLNKQERLIIICYYFEGERMCEISKQLGIPESTVSQMHGRLLQRLSQRKELRECFSMKNSI